MEEGAAGRGGRDFERGGKAAASAEISEDTVRDLHAKIGELAVANDSYEEDSVKGAQFIARPLDHGRRSGLTWAG